MQRPTEEPRSKTKTTNKHYKVSLQTIVNFFTVYTAANILLRFIVVPHVYGKYKLRYCYSAFMINAKLDSLVYTRLES